MNDKLYLITQKGEVREVPPEEYGALEHGAPSLEYMRRALNCSTIEHAATLFCGTVVHLFFDENGLFSSALPNDRASAILGNKRLRGMRLEKFRYNDLSTEPPPAIATLVATDMMIVGDCFMWVGELE